MGAVSRHLRALGALAALLLAALPTSARAAATPNDPGFRAQWSLAAIGAVSAWSHADGAGVRIAIVDSGVDLQHPELRGKIAASADCVGGNGSCVTGKGKGQDDDGHGTHVAGIAAAAAGNGQGIAGVAPKAELLAIRVLETCQAQAPCPASGRTVDVDAGIHWAVDHGAKVINLSVGFPTEAVLGPQFGDALQYAWDHGAVPVVAAGNDYVLSKDFSRYPAVLVAATNRDGSQASYSDGVGQARWGLFAPGGEPGDTASTCSDKGDPVGVLSTYWIAGQPEPQYACEAGTSMAAPHVAAALALLLSPPTYAGKPEAAVRRLIDTAKPVPGVSGAGALDLAKATAGMPPLRSGPTSSSSTTAAPPPSTSTTATTAPAASAASSSTTTTTGLHPASTVTTGRAPTVAGGEALSHRRKDDDAGLSAGPVMLAFLAAGATGALSWREVLRQFPHLLRGRRA
jgi:serine protease